MTRRTKRQVILSAGLIVSLGCLLYLFIDVLGATQSDVNDVFNVHSVTTAVAQPGRVISATFAVLNIPPAIVYVVIESSLPRSMAQKTRGIVVFSTVAAAVIAWWWFLALITRRKGG